MTTAKQITELQSQVTTNQKSFHPKYRPDIDGLRAIAVLSVIVFHAFPNLITGGFVGVDVFFVISGFLISSIIFENLENQSFNYFDFYKRRIRRIFPALILVLIGSYAVGWYLLLPDEYKQLGKHISGGAGFASNLILWNESGYFDSTSDTKPLLHLWSLGIEEQFYILWPLLLGLVWKRRLNFLTITVAIAVASFAYNVYTVQNNAIEAFYSPASRFWELMIGGILAYVSLHRPQLIPNNYGNTRSAIGIVLIAVSVWFITKISLFPGWLALLPTIGAFLILSSPPASWVNRNVLGNQALSSIGLISYPLYLWHWPILSFLRIYESGTPSPSLRTIAVISSFVLAWITYILVEKRLRFGPNGAVKAVALLFLIGVIGLVGYNTYLRDGLSFRMLHLSKELVGVKPNTSKEWRIEKCFLEKVDQFSDSCMDEIKPLIFLWGDSHSAALYPGFRDLKSKFGYGVAQYTASGCKPFVGNAAIQDKRCEAINQKVLTIVQNSKPDYVMLHAEWSSMNDMANLKTTIDAIKNAGIKNVVVIGPDPIWKDELPRLIFSYYRKNHSQLPFRMTENNANSLVTLDSAMNDFANHEKVKYISSLKMLCNQDGCMIRTAPDSVDIMVMDFDHLTPQGSIFEVGFILKELLLRPAE
jgi:peptidoglycan/LPS O-acetylase OafA/YrhL